LLYHLAGIAPLTANRLGLFLSLLGVGDSVVGGSRICAAVLSLRILLVDYLFME
jgi:hypothetical protein